MKRKNLEYSNCDIAPEDNKKKLTTFDKSILYFSWRGKKSANMFQYLFDML